MKLYILVIFSGLCTHARNVCMTWAVKKNQLSLLCSVDSPLFAVIILDPSGIEKAACLGPSTNLACSTYHINGKTEHNLLTNTTILTITIDTNSDALNGNWTCRHGVGRLDEQASTEVTLQHIGLATGKTYNETRKRL